MMSIISENEEEICHEEKSLKKKEFRRAGKSLKKLYYG